MADDSPLKIDIANESITRVAFGHQIDLLTDEGSNVQIENIFTIRPSGVVVDPGTKPVEAAHELLNLFGLQITDARVVDSVLEIAFSDGQSIVVPPQDHYESWNISTPGRSPSLVVMAPDGEIVIFG